MEDEERAGGASPAQRDSVLWNGGGIVQDTSSKRHPSDSLLDCMGPEQAPRDAPIISTANTAERGRTIRIQTSPLNLKKRPAQKEQRRGPKKEARHELSEEQQIERFLRTNPSFKDVDLGGRSFNPTLIPKLVSQFSYLGFDVLTTPITSDMAKLYFKKHPPRTKKDSA